MTVEVSMIGFMVGTCIAFFVVIGDLAPPIIASTLNISESVNFAYAVQSVICFFLVLPLTLLRNLESLFAVSISSVVFYCCVMLHIILAAKTSIFDGSWTANVMWLDKPTSLKLGEV
jgi:sodium-coupled neutral amino acid transporter 10